MKHISKLVVAFFVLSSVFFNSCDKEIETSSLTVNTAQKGIVKAFVFADLDRTLFGNELAQVGTKVIVTVNYADLGLASTGNLIDTTIVDADGKIEVTVPSDADGVTVKLQPVDFIFDQVQEFNSNFPTVKKFYSATVKSVTVKANDVQVVNIVYDAPETFGNFNKFAKIGGKITADLDESTTGNETVQPNTQITFFCAGWSKTASVGSNGTYNVEVPESQDITIAYSFTYSKKVSDGNGGYTLKTFIYKSTSSAVSKFTSNNLEYDINLGGGIEVK